MKKKMLTQRSRKGTMGELCHPGNNNHWRYHYHNLPRCFGNGDNGSGNNAMRFLRLFWSLGYVKHLVSSFMKDQRHPLSSVTVTAVLFAIILCNCSGKESK